MFPARLQLLALLPILWSAVGSAQGVPPDFTPLAGVRELTGRLIARPVQAEDAAGLGLTPEQWAELRAVAAAAMDEHERLEFVPETDESILQVALGAEEADGLALLSTGAFQYVTPDWLVYPASNSPNDANFASQAYHAPSLLDSCVAWDWLTGDPTTVVALCDTGIRTTHEDLLLHREEGYNAVDQKWENAGGDIGALLPHGTQTTGVACANGNNGLGITGVGWNLGHRMMRVTNLITGAATVSTITHAARTAADVGDKVINVSYDGATSPSVGTTATYVRGKGALLIWAAGNSGLVLNGDREDDLIVVGATELNDSLPSWSNRGPFVDLVAPGNTIHTTDGSGDSAYAFLFGTSLSAPMVAGLCALMFSANPNLTPAEVEILLRAGCTDLGTVGVDDLHGYGRIDLAATLLPFQCPALVGGRVHTDLNGNCHWDQGEPVWSGWTVRLLDGWGQTAQSDVTDAQGAYFFPSVPTGFYTLEALFPGDWFPVCPANGKVSFLAECLGYDFDFAVAPLWHLRRAPRPPSSL